MHAGVAIDELEAAAAAAGHGSGAATIARSPTTMLVKNLPFQVTEEELQVKNYRQMQGGPSVQRKKNLLF